MKRSPNVKTEISLHILAYNMKRVTAVLGARPLIEAIRVRDKALRTSSIIRSGYRRALFLTASVGKQT